MREIEIKARVQNKSQLIAKLEKLGTKLNPPKKQRDIVYSLPGVQANEPDANWLRIRIEDDNKYIFTLKRSVTNELDSIEHEVTIDSAEEMAAIVGHLGYKLFSDLTKVRQKAKLGDIEICIDEVPKLGLFIEAEKLCPDDANYDKVAAELWGLMDKLGITKRNEESSGYDVLLHRLEKQKQPAA